MDFQTLIIGLIITTIILIPLVYIQLSQKSKRKQIRQEFLKEVQKNKLQLSTVEYWGTFYAIAIDTKANKLIYSKKENQENIWIELDINSITDCTIAKTERIIKNKTTQKVETDRIDLQITSKGKNPNIVLLEFYNVDINLEMTDEKLLLEKWQSLIKSLMLKHKLAA